MRKQTQTAQKTYNVGIYCRLSRDDGNSESLSIQSQKMFLKDYVQKQNWSIVDYFCDDGVSGSTFDRPELNRLIENVEQGKINLVICKDLSRFGRNYIMAGQFCEMYFPNKGVRFIALNDNFDTLDERTGDFVPLMNFMNELYIRDASRKVRAIKNSRAKNGLFMGTCAPYGYKKDPNNHNQLIVDDETSPVVRRIFDLYVQGYGSKAIRNILNKDRILIPSAVINNRSPQFYNWCFDGADDPRRYNWKVATIKKILTNQTYLGHLVSNKQPVTSYKNKKRINNSQEDWIIVPNTHEQIIDQNTWDIVQNTADTRRRKVEETHHNYGFVNEFSGIIRCADCGRSMSHRIARYNGKKKVSINRYYGCSTNETCGSQRCSFHYLKHDMIQQLILESVRKYAALSKHDKEAMAKMLMESGTHQQAYEFSQAKKEIKSSEKRLKELERLVTKLYEEYVAERVSNENYTMLIGKYQMEQTELRQKVDRFNLIISQNDESSQNINEFVSLIEKYADLKELSPEIVSQLIEKIAVHEVQIFDGKRTQQIDILWRFVGNINLLQ